MQTKHLDFAESQDTPSRCFQSSVLCVSREQAVGWRSLLMLEGKGWVLFKVQGSIDTKLGMGCGLRTLVPYPGMKWCRCGLLG